MLLRFFFAMIHVRFVLGVISRSTHPLDYHLVYFLSQIERRLISLAETWKIRGEVEIGRRIDVGADKFHLGRSSVVPEVSFADAEAVDKFIGFDPGFPPLDPALSVLQILAPLRIQVSHRTQVTAGIGVAL